MRGHLTIENEIADGLLEIGGIDLAGFYAALKRFIDRRESAENKKTMPFTVNYFCKKFSIGKSRFYRLANLLWQVGLLDIEKDYSRNGWLNTYMVHDFPDYPGSLQVIREGSFKYTKSDKPQEGGYSDMGIPTAGIPGAECKKRKDIENTNIVVEPEPKINQQAKKQTLIC